MSTAPLDGLATFLAVGRHKSFTAAAAELAVTPTAVSQKIKLLEQNLGAVLFQRTTRRVALTEGGAALFERVRPALGEIDDALVALHDFGRRPSGTLRITAARTSGFRLVPIITRMRETYPALAIELSLDDAFVDIVERGFDAGVRLGDAVEKDMIRVQLTKETRWSIVASPAYLGANGRPERPEDLVRHRTIRQRFLGSGMIYRWELEKRGKPLTVDVPGGIVVDDIALIAALARDGAGLAYVADETVEVDLAAGRLERVLEGFVTPGPGLYVYFPARSGEQPKLRALVETIAELRAPRHGARGRSRPPSR
jgi:DNA-binding transcriptional LysR family regulator